MSRALNTALTTRLLAVTKQNHEVSIVAMKSTPARLPSHYDDTTEGTEAVRLAVNFGVLHNRGRPPNLVMKLCGHDVPSQGLLFSTTAQRSICNRIPCAYESTTIYRDQPPKKRDRTNGHRRSLEPGTTKFAIMAGQPPTPQPCAGRSTAIGASELNYSTSGLAARGNMRT